MDASRSVPKSACHSRRNGARRLSGGLVLDLPLVYRGSSHRAPFDRPDYVTTKRNSKGLPPSIPEAPRVTMNPLYSPGSSCPVSSGAVLISA